jgi:histidinol-phosphate phosphatase family protein
LVESILARDRDSRVAEYYAFRDELQTIITARYTVLTGATSLYALLFAFVGGFSESLLRPLLPLLLSTITLPVLIINHYLTTHYRRIDSFLMSVETDLPGFAFYKHYPIFTKIRTELAARRLPSFARRIVVQSAYTAPILLAYSLLVALGATVSFVLGNPTEVLWWGEVVFYVGFSFLLIGWTSGKLGIGRPRDPIKDLEMTWKVLAESNKAEAPVIKPPPPREDDQASSGEPMQTTRASPQALIFMDRDGVLCKNRPEGVLTYGDFEVVENLEDALYMLNVPSLRIAIITNQPYINEGRLRLDDLDRMNERLNTFAEKAGIKLANFKIYVCPHKADEHCNCRKPETGNLDKAFNEFFDGGLADVRSYLIGDQVSDMEAGNRFRREHPALKTILVDWKYGDNSKGERKERKRMKPDYFAHSLLGAAYWIRVQEAVRSR